MNTTRRTFLKNATAGLGSIAVGSLSARRSSAAPASLTFVSWGGTTQDAQKASWVDPFTKKTGIAVLEDGPTDYGKLKAMVESGNVTWDVVDVEGFFAHKLAQEGLLEPIDYGVVKNAELDPRFSFDHGVGSFLSSYVLGYNKDALGGKVPQTWVDLFDMQNFPGKRAIYKWVSVGAPEIALLADGVAPEKLYPLDLDRVFAKLDTIKKEIVWWGSGAQSQQLLASGETPIGMFWNGRIYAMQKDGPLSVGIGWNQHIPGPDILVVPKGSKNKDAAMQFIAIAASPEGQAEMSNATAYTPINSEAVPLLKKDMLPFLPLSYRKQEVPADLEYWAKNVDEISKRWYAWQAA